MIKKHIAIICLFCMVWSCTGIKNEIGKPYAGWKNGEMDIHHIYTGRGEANFHIFPDGTSMLIDAGDWDPSDYDKMCELLPDSSRRSGEWIARYIKQVNPFKNHVDYLVVSHFHNDHIGDCSNKAKQTSGRNPDYVLTGIAEVGETISFSKMIDRGWPDYQYPFSVNDLDADNYRTFVDWKIETEGLYPERFEIGSNEQIVLLKNKEKYHEAFSIQNLAANGKIWTGEGLETTDYYELHLDNKTNWQNENTKSIAMRISYGPFSYYTGGDLSGKLLDEKGNPVDIEEEVAKICGTVDVCKANHHAYKDAMTNGFVKNIGAFAYIIPVWDYEHIQPTVMERIISLSPHEGGPKIFPTQFPTKLRSQYSKEKWLNSVCQKDGHVVVKVFDMGRKYKIYVLSPQDENQIVKGVYGPYYAKSDLLNK
ncbi:MAG: hypothetical protein PHI70_02655 [Proteiniphilum sp.]|nr:hypothetical protein [Proteiniphilum sp.]MDD3909057.1 hypothetical protein [Proteiniphilum sp.]MDD4415674.1 hypothetical protein [Proteiniphilum sp.]